jgi:sec-independent protein translocase protein TatA
MARVVTSAASQKSAWLSVLLILILIALLLYGGNRLGALGKGLGEGVKTFKKSLRESEAQPPPKTVRVETLESRPLPEPEKTSELPPPDEEPH